MAKDPPLNLLLSNTSEVNIVKKIAIENLSRDESMDGSSMASVHGGRFKHPFQQVTVDQLLTTPDGDPVDVYVDGVKVNSVSTGFYHL